MKNIYRDQKSIQQKQLTMKNKFISITNEENKSYLEQKACHICGIEFSANDDNKKYEVRDH